MGPIEAFRRLGYEPANNYVWSVLKDDGLCLALWDGEIDRTREPLMVFDTRLDAGPTDWRDDPKAMERLRQLRIASEKFDGRIDVVLRRGTPHANDGTAQAWERIGARASTFWRCDDLDLNAREFVIRLHRSGDRT